MKTRRRMHIGVGCILLFLILTGGMVSFVRRNRPLPDRSIPVADTHGWWQEDPVVRPYQWLSDHELFSHSGWWRLQKPFTYDIHTKRKTPLSALQKHLEHDIDDDDIDSWEMSPDRQRVAWSLEYSGAVRMSRLDGSDYQRVSLEDKGHGNTTPSVEWLADNRRWLAWTIDYESGKAAGIALGDIRTPGRLTWLTQEQVDRLDTGTEVHYSEGEPASVILPDTTPTPRGATQVKRRTITLKPPPGMEIVELVPDPSRHRLLWLLSGRSVPPWLFRFLQLSTTESENYTAFSISRIDGMELQEIGRIYTPKTYDGPSDIAWLPDGKQISYLYQDILYTVSAD